MQLEQDQSVRSMNFPFDAYSTELSAALGAWVLLEPNEEGQTEGTVGGGGSQACGERSTESRSGSDFTPNVRNVELQA